MKVTLEPAPWTDQEPSRELLDAVDLLGEGTWRDAAVHFHRVVKEKKKLGVRVPKGIQPYLNDIIDTKFLKAGWAGRDGNFRKGQTWIRVTFRHQMSLGSDFLEALRLVKKEGVKQAAIFAA